MANPFYYGGRVPPELFVGRKAELTRIFDRLEVVNTKQLQSTSIVGPRRIGKSSLLYYMANRYTKYLANPDHYRFAYINLQSAECKNRAILLGKILAELKLVPPTGTLTLVEFEHVLDGIKQQTIPLYPVICIDEFERLAEKPDEFGNDLFDSWRALMDEHAVAFVTASKVSLRALADDKQLTSHFFNEFSMESLGELSIDDTQILIDRGLKCDLPFDDGDQNQISMLAHNHPYKIQLVGSLIYQARLGSGEVDRKKIESQFAYQLEQIDLDEPTITQQVGNEAVGLGRRLGQVPAVIGRAILEGILLRKKDDISPSTTWIVGAVAIGLVVLIVLGWVSFSADDLWKLIERARGAK